jgi:hypothetical protein
MTVFRSDERIAAYGRPAPVLGCGSGEPVKWKTFPEGRLFRIGGWPASYAPGEPAGFAPDVLLLRYSYSSVSSKYAAAKLSPRIGAPGVPVVDVGSGMPIVLAVLGIVAISASPKYVLAPAPRMGSGV